MFGILYQLTQKKAHRNFFPTSFLSVLAEGLEPPTFPTSCRDTLPIDTKKSSSEFFFQRAFFPCWRRDSNPQPADYKSAALPVELRKHNFQILKIKYNNFFSKSQINLFPIRRNFKNYYYNK